MPVQTVGRGPSRVCSSRFRGETVAGPLALFRFNDQDRPISRFRLNSRRRLIKSLRYDPDRFEPHWLRTSADTEPIG